MSEAADYEFVSTEWGPSRIDAGDLGLLSEITGRTAAECLEKLNTYGPEHMGAAWRAADPSSPAEMRDFYAATDLYLWELFCWNGSESYRPYIDRLVRLSEAWPPSSYPRALDFGCGIGTSGLQLVELGYDVTIADVPGLTLDFARERFGRRGYRVNVLEITDDLPGFEAGPWDVLVSFDVLEHVPNPAVLTRRLTQALVRGGGAAIVAAFDWGDSRWPHHLAEGRLRFGGRRWELYLRSLGLTGIGDFLYRREERPVELARRLRYAIWEKTGVYFERIER